MLVVFIVATTSTMLYRKEPLPTIVTVIGALLSLIYFIQKQKLEELRVFRELFKEFNVRYDALNEELAKIVEGTDMVVSKQEREQLIDYFNLCGEEYFYFMLGYIDPSVWTAWENGMKSIFSAPRVQLLWVVEKRTGSYYGLPL